MKIFFPIFFLIVGQCLTTDITSRIEARKNRLADINSLGEERKDCEECDPKNCPPFDILSCDAGSTKDQCGCCDVCARAEYELCDLEHITRVDRYYGSCGARLKCTTIGEEEAAWCRCVDEKASCGTDGQTYENICQMMESMIYRRRMGLSQIQPHYKGPCKAGASIVKGPTEIVSNGTEETFFQCEVTGNPIPVIEWFYTNDIHDQSISINEVPNAIILPGDDDHVSALVRGGPNHYEATGWLQIIGGNEHDEGTYICTAFNQFGKDSKSAPFKYIGERVGKSTERKLSSRKMIEEEFEEGDF
ncbi:hypothetical protein SNEBB_009245 [Seison nebaliae]|nr:hypothetical protein SNEBB_009245 [Seison nebaliae]